MPELSLGDDDIEWVSVLHRGLQSAGYYPSDDECENWLFGEGTQKYVSGRQMGRALPKLEVHVLSREEPAGVHHRSRATFPKSWKQALQGQSIHEVGLQLPAQKASGACPYTRPWWDPC
eukprot:scaffold309646_cov17-Tisochrysis_lutea.AAC.2